MIVTVTSFSYKRGLPVSVNDTDKFCEAVCVRKRHARQQAERLLAGRRA